MPDRLLLRGEGTIEAVAPRLEVEDAEVIDVGRPVVMPGFEDTTAIQDDQ
jgi:cytosine/adenosine deaminase-related metal-dependent hydrolase